MIDEAAQIKPEDLAEHTFRNDFAAWFEGFGSITLKDGREVLPKANYLQAKIAAVKREFRRRKLPCRIITLKPRQRGSTTISAADLYASCRRLKTSACIIGAQYSQCENALGIVRDYHRADRFPWGNDGSVIARSAKWSNGSKIQLETAGDGEAGRSGTFQYVIATEAARWSEQGVANAADVFAGLLKCVGPVFGTTIIIESTARGNSGYYYDAWTTAMDADDFLAGKELRPGDYVRVFAPWFEFTDSTARLDARQQAQIEATIDHDTRYMGEADLINEFGWRDAGGVMRLGKSCSSHPHADKTWTAWEQLAWRRWAIDNECKKSVENFNQDYPESWEKAFLRSGSRRFNSAGLSYIRQRLRTPQYGMLEERKDRVRGGPVVWNAAQEHEAFFCRWEEPREGYRYLLCADTMTGADRTTGKDPDCHAIFVLRQGWYDRERGWIPPAVVARIKAPCRWAVNGILDVEIWKLAQYYGGRRGCLIVPESNMDCGLIELLKGHGARIVERKVYNQREERMTGQLGHRTDKTTREPCIEELAKAIREYGRDGEGLDIWDAHALAEMETFVRKETGRSEHEDGKHDDDVLSLSIGYHYIAQATELVAEVRDRSLPPDIAAALAEQSGRRIGGAGRRQFA